MVENREPDPPSNDTMTPQQALEEASADLLDAVQRALFAMRAVDPTISPTAAAMDTYRFVAEGLETLIPAQVVSTALLVTFEGRHAAPMSFVEINDAKKALVTISAARRRATSRPSIIKPGG